MSKNKKLTSRIICVLLIAFGLVLGITWNKEFCVGDNLFTALGLPAWSNGTTGTHYPAISGIFFILIGIGLLNYTLQKKVRIWIWTLVIFVLIVMNMIFSYT